LDIFEVKYLTQKLLLRFKHKDSNMNYEQGFSRGCRCGVAPLEKISMVKIPSPSIFGVISLLKFFSKR
jgi:hypothetical protein